MGASVGVATAAVAVGFCPPESSVCSFWNKKCHIQTPNSLKAANCDLASFPGSHAWAEKKQPGTHCLRMLSSPRISGNLEIFVKSAPLH